MRTTLVHALTTVHRIGETTKIRAGNPDSALAF